MSDQAASTAPKGYTAVTPWIIGRDTAKLLDYVVAAFDAVEIARVHNPDGAIGHAEFRIDDAIVMAFDVPPGSAPTPAFLRLYVADCDATYQKALAAGGTSHTEPTTAPFGERVARVLDPFGNLWWIHTRVEDVSQEEFVRRLDNPKWLAALAYLQAQDPVAHVAR
ncbi:VOC family protein [Solihabitans fulvus]|uniref:VOC family protein n=1 Tax=Solihabitans fulvus TaxID=1892852 RepID=A0A5B2WRU8_9PSEU|nr:VOC family protein [Solihabitans fulvus]KAA2252687.1 VOC family protein [Solihabitans fulvus]